MLYEKEFSFLIGVFNKNRLKSRIVNPDEIMPVTKSELASLLSGELPIAILKSEPKEFTVYNFTDSFGIKYKYMLVSEKLFVIGPYTKSIANEGELLEIAEAHG